MTTLAADKSRTFELGDINELPVIASDIIYEGAAVGMNGSGYARPLTAGDQFVGFAEQNVDNSAGAAGDKTVRVLTKGFIKLSIGSLAITDIGKPVYASDDDTFTLTESTNSHVGRVHRFISTGVGVLSFDADCAGAGIITALTDNSAGTASDTLVAISGTYTQTEVRNSIASLAAKINSMIKQHKS
jgi:hypothetical protein